MIGAGSGDITNEGHKTVSYPTYMRRLLLVTAALSISGCGPFAKKPTEDKNPLLLTECPAELPPLKDGATFGDSNLKLIEVAGIYHACRSSALTGSKQK